MNKRKRVSCDDFPNVPAETCRSCFCVCRSEVREAAGIFFVFIRDEENGVLKFIVMEFLKCDCGCDGGENWDVWREKAEFFTLLPRSYTHTHTHQMQDDTHTYPA